MKAEEHPFTYFFPEYVRKRLTNINTFIAILRAVQMYSTIPVVEWMNQQDATMKD